MRWHCREGGRITSLQERICSDRVIFNYRGKQRMFTLGQVAESEAKAKAKAAQVDYRLMRLKQGLIEMPPISDVVAFFRHDGPPPVARSGISAP